jgi:hypothetical protein
MNRDNPNNVLGVNSADNNFVSDLVSSNADGSILERLEYIQATVLPGRRTATKTLSTIANGNTTLFNFTGSVRITNIIGVVTTLMQTKTQNTKLSIVADSLTAVDVCANVDLTAAAVGTLLSITGTAADAMVASANGAIAPGQAGGIVATCITSGIIKMVAGAANTGAIKWIVQYEPLTSDGAITAA